MNHRGVSIEDAPCIERYGWEQNTFLSTAEINPPSHGVKYGWLPTLPSASRAHWQRRQD